MEIVMITGSGRKNGTSNYLADEFAKGAIESGNKVYRFDCSDEKVEPCIGCGYCRKNSGCIHVDSFEKLIPHIILAQVVVFSTPVYYMTMTSQLKAVIDRFYQLELKPGFKNNKKYILLSTAWDKREKVFDVIVNTFDIFCNFLKWNKYGMVLASGMDKREDIENSTYGKAAYELGKKLVENS